MSHNNHSQRGFAIPLVIALVAIVLVLGGVAYYANQPQTEQDKMEQKSAVLAGTSAPLLDFQKADYDAAVKSDKLILLYFYASWCPICKAEFPIAQGVFNELITDNVVGFRVNYNDNETDADEVALARQFGVAYQHTKVFVKNGARILKSPEG